MSSGSSPRLLRAPPEEYLYRSPDACAAWAGWAKAHEMQVLYLPAKPPSGEHTQFVSSVTQTNIPEVLEGRRVGNLATLFSPQKGQTSFSTLMTGSGTQICCVKLDLDVEDWDNPTNKLALEGRNPEFGAYPRDPSSTNAQETGVWVFAGKVLLWWPHGADVKANESAPIPNTIRVTYFYDPTKGDFGPGKEFLPVTEVSTIGALLDGGKAGDLVTFLSPRSAENHNVVSRLQTGVGERTHYVEFEILSSKVKPVGGLKGLIWAIRKEQVVVEGKVPLPPHAVWGELPRNWLAEGANKGGAVLMLIGAAVLFWAQDTRASDEGEKVSENISRPPNTGTEDGGESLGDTIRRWNEKKAELRYEIGRTGTRAFAICSGFGITATMLAVGFICRVRAARKQKESKERVMRAIAWIFFLTLVAALSVKWDICWLQTHRVVPQTFIPVLWLVAALWVGLPIGVALFMRAREKRYNRLQLHPLPVT